MSNRVLVLQDIVKALSHETDTSEALCQSFVKELFAIVAERLMDGESVTLKGVGRFDVDGGEVRFVADPDTAAAINSAFDCFEAIELADDFDGDEPVAEDETPDAAEEETATTVVDETAGTEDVADESPADGAEPEEKESQTDGLEESEADSEEEKEGVEAIVRKFFPEKEIDVNLFKGKMPLFEVYGLENQISELQDRKVWLPSGAYLVIDQTEALTVIDVNTGSRRCVVLSVRSCQKTVVSACCNCR